ncbi:MAG: hypothetical protein IT452_04730 [Planctomycetia bacterium]|nr:hypothetical protein [Planctomycetia bacterium]
MRTTLALLLLSAPALFAQAPEALDEKACLELARKIEAAVQAADGEAFDRILNLRGLIETALKNVEAEAKLKKDFTDGASSSSLGEQLCEQVSAGATFRFLRFHTVNGRTCALFRLINPEGGVNYHDYVLGKDGAGVKADDLYVYLMGESISRIFKREFLKAVAIESKRAGNLKGWEKDYVDAQPRIEEMQAAAGAGKWKKALKAYNEMPQTVREDKLVMIQRVGIALKCGDEEYKAALDDWERLFPGDPSMDLMKIDSHAMKGELELSAAAAERLAGTIGGDPFLDAMRSGLMMQAGKLEEAAALAAKAAKDEKGLKMPHFVLLQLSLKKKDHAATAAELTILEKECGVPIGDLENEADFAEFVKSEEYKKWSEGRE